MSREINGINDIPTNFNADKQADTHTITEWCLKLKISLLDTKYFEDDKEYTIQEFESIIPKDIQVPLPEETFNEEKLLSFNKDEGLLNTLIRGYYQDKANLDFYKKATDTTNKEIKELMLHLNTGEFETDNGLIAKMNIQQRENFNEPALIEKLLEIDAKETIDLVPVINWDKVEDMIYNGKLDPAILAPYKETKEIITLKVSVKRGE